MIFLLEYDRQSGLLIQIREYKDEQRERASKDRLELEIHLFQRGVSREVVLLEAQSEQDLRRTHNRYFGNVSDLAKSVKTTVKLVDHGEKG